MPAARTLTLLFAAAVVTVMKERRDYDSVEQAERAVGIAAKIHHRDIKNFRDNLNRGKAPELAMTHYRDVLEQVRLCPTPALLKKSLPDLSKFL